MAWEKEKAAFAEGKRIQFKRGYTRNCLSSNSDEQWITLGADNEPGTVAGETPRWLTGGGCAYRVHPDDDVTWFKERKAAAAGKIIEMRFTDEGAWMECRYPMWFSGCKYRVKPKAPVVPAAPVAAVTPLSTPFYVVWQPGTANPRVRHATYELAEAEAKRLARVHPNKEFFVLSSVYRVKNQSVTTVTVNEEKYARG